MSRPLPTNWPAIRRRVLARDEHRCTARLTVNGEPVGRRCPETGHGAGGPLEVDHIIARKDGGDDSLANLRTLCAWDHAQRSAKQKVASSASFRARARKPEAHPGSL